jgi:predicted HicB family RNase H-like nuclease
MLDPGVQTIDSVAVDAIKYLLGTVTVSAFGLAVKVILQGAAIKHLKNDVARLKRRDEIHHDKLIQLCNEMGINPPKEITGVFETFEDEST